MPLLLLLISAFMKKAALKAGIQPDVISTAGSLKPAARNALNLAVNISKAAKTTPLGKAQGIFLSKTGAGMWQAHKLGITRKMYAEFIRIASDFGDILEKGLFKGGK